MQNLTNKISSLFRLSLITILPILFFIGCLGQSQNPKELFNNGKLPRLLNKVANREAKIRSNRDEILRIIEDRKKNPKYRVAVIDNGADLFHPDLFKRIHWELKDGEIAAGYDVLGGDFIADATLIDPLLFSYGAKNISNNKISGEIESPLKLMGQHNDSFMDELIKKIALDKSLNNTFFKNINRNNFSIFGASRLVLDGFDQSSYDEHLGLKKLKNPADLTKPINIKSIEKKYENSLGLYNFIKPWRMNPYSGLPFSGFSTLIGIEGADVFFKIVEKTLNSFKLSQEFNQSVDKFIEFSGPLAFPNDNLTKDKLDSAYSLLQKSLYFKLFGYRATDPIHLVNETVNNLYVRQTLSIEDVIKNKGIVNPVKAKTELLNNFDKIEELVNIQNEKGHMDPTQEKLFAKMSSEMHVIKNLTSHYLNSRDWTNYSNITPAGYTPNSSQYRKQLWKSHHPYLSSDSSTVSHSTHVPAIIALQNPDISIVPIRVATSSISLSPDKKKELGTNFKKQLKSWIETPLVARAIADLLKEHYPDDVLKGNNSVNRKNLAIKVLKLFNYQIEAAIETQSLEFVFLNQINEAIKYVGKNKIQIANASLGTSFEKAVLDPNKKNYNEENTFKFLLYEFYKYNLAQTIKKYAPNTVFFIATGNNGQWMDGESRSGVPVDLSSPFLEKFQTKNSIAPNNKLNNIIAVGSIDPHDKLSSFTNIPLGLRSPFILSHGESIFSPINTTDLSSVEDIMNNELPEIKKFSSLEFNELIVLNNHKKLIPKHLSTPELNEIEMNSENITAYAIESIRNIRSAFSSISGAMVMQLHTQFKVVRAKMTGTSMASPTAAGIMANAEILHIQKSGLGLDETYNHRDFTPEKIVDRLYKNVKPLKKGSRGITLEKLIGEKVFKKSTQGDDLVAFLKNIKLDQPIISTNCSKFFSK